MKCGDLPLSDGPKQLYDATRAELIASKKEVNKRFRPKPLS